MTLRLKCPEERRGFLTALMAGAATAAIPTTADAQNAQSFVFKPDFQAIVAGQAVPVDLALLGPNGEKTAGFVASLDPFHGQPFSQGWNLVYGFRLQGNPKNTDPALIEQIKTHITTHGIKAEDLDSIYEQALKAWKARPDLRTNASRSSAAEPDAPTTALG